MSLSALRRQSFGSLRAKTPLALPNETIGLMGGTFNPPHDGHLVVAQTALKRLGLSRVWWLVTPGNPLKDHADLAPLTTRIKAIDNLHTNPKFVVTAFERPLNTPYTAATLSFLKRRYPATKFVWVMGADNLATFHRWQHWQTIARTFPMAVIDRPGWRFPALSSPAARALAPKRMSEHQAPGLPLAKPPAWAFLTTRLSSTSSTELRRLR